MAGELGSVSGSVRLDIRQAVAAYAALRAQNARTVYAMRGTGDAFVQSGRVMSAAGLGLIGVFGLAVKAAADFERKMDFFAAVTNTSKSEMAELNKVTLDLAKNTIYTADQMAEGFIELGKAGVSARDIMDGIGQAMANLGAAGDIPLAQAGQIITSTLQQFDMGANRAVEVTDLLAGAANASIADITDIGVSLKYVGGVANAVGLTFEDTATAISLLAKAGIRGSTAGTSLRQMLVSLGGATGPARETMKDLGIITEDGSNKFFTAEGKAKSLSRVFQILQNHTADLSQKERLMALRTIFNNRALAAASILTREGAKGFRDMNAEMGKTTAADTARERLDNLSGDIEILKGNIETMLTEAGGPFQEMLRGWTQNLTSLVQAFGNLDPETQKLIMQTIAITGVVLTALGALTMFIGFIFRVAVAMSRMGAAIKFVFGVAKGLLWFFGLLAGGTISGTVLAIAGAFIAVGAALYLAYQKVAPFREFIDYFASEFMKGLQQVGAAIGVVIGFFQRLATDPVSVWEDIKSAVSSAASAIGGAFAAVPGLILSALSSIGSAVGGVVNSIVGWFASLPGRILSLMGALVNGIMSFFAQLPGRLGFIIGFMLGVAVAGMIRLMTAMATYASLAVTRTLSFFSSLPGRIGFFIGFMVGRAIALMVRLVTMMISLGSRAVTGTINFFARLPGRVASFVSAMAARVQSFFSSMRNRAVALTLALVNGVINFFSSLPGRIAGFMATMVNRVTSAFRRLPGIARSFASQVYNGFMNGIRGLPGAVSGIVGNMISAFRGAITSAINAVRDFAAGMWRGFKQGLGMKSPSLIEKATWQITGVLDTETKKIAKKTMQIQALSKQMAKTQFGVGDSDFGTSTIKTIAASRVAGDELLAQAKLAAPGVKVSVPEAGRTKVVEGELSLSPSGRAFISGVAQDVVDENYVYDDDLDRME